MRREMIPGLPDFRRIRSRTETTWTYQRRVTEKINVSYWVPDNQDPRKLAEQLIELADRCAEGTLSIEHETWSSGDYSCETHLEFLGWEDVDESVVQAARDRLSATRRTAALEQRRHAQQELARLKREHPEIF